MSARIVPLTHGYSGYRRGCRCSECRAANAARSLHRRSRGEAPEQAHGTRGGYNNYGCRCAPCTAANSAASAAYKRNLRPSVASTEVKP